MAAYTDAPFRSLCAKYGAGAAYTELVSASAIVRKNPKTFEMVRARGEKYPLGLQIFGSSAEEISNAAKICGEYAQEGKCDAKFVDLNFGCPASKVVRIGGGSAILATPKKAGEIVNACVKKCALPISVKIRLGFKEKNYLEVAKIVEGAGASALCVHCRTKEEGFSEKFDWNAIGEIKSAVSIPLIGNGGVRMPADAKRMMEQTGCDYVMVGRAALGNPYFFAGKGAREVDARMRFAAFSEYLEIARKMDALQYEYVKAHALEFASGFEKANRVRERLGKGKSVEEIETVIKEVALKYK
ncbi:tRNA-dihydrouridine synthase B [Candidatus Anstonella stagnisolia]|nr:tRNA-dihydrouridine synthase B [Candidatus Anstonella stagnisolia]